MSFFAAASMPSTASAGRPTCHSLPTFLPLVYNLLPVRIPSELLPASNQTMRSYLWAIAATVPDLTSIVTCSSAHILVNTRHRDSSVLSSWLRCYHLSIYFRCLQVRISTSPHLTPLEFSVYHAIAYHDFPSTKCITFVTQHKKLF